jgi:hypothetical protein
MAPGKRDRKTATELENLWRPGALECLRLSVARAAVGIERAAALREDFCRCMNDHDLP